MMSELGNYKQSQYTKMSNYHNSINFSSLDGLHGASKMAGAPKLLSTVTHLAFCGGLWQDVPGIPQSLNGRPWTLLHWAVTHFVGLHRPQNDPQKWLLVKLEVVSSHFWGPWKPIERIAGQHDLEEASMAFHWCFPTDNYQRHHIGESMLGAATHSLGILASRKPIQNVVVFVKVLD